MIHPPFITAIITTFQRPKLLQRAIESVQKQTISNLSISIFDSASQDNTEAVVNEIAKKDPRVSYYRYPRAVSPVENYQFGMEQVKTPFFSFLSDDDFLFPGFYEKALFLFKKHPSAEFFLGSTIDASLDAKPISAEAQNWPNQEFYLPSEGLLHVIRSYFNWTGAVYRTKAVQTFLLNPDVVPGDHDFILRLAAHYPFTFSPAPCAIFTHHPGSFSNRCGLELIYPSLFKIADTIYKLRPTEELPSLKDAFNRSFLRKGLRIGIQNLARKNFAELRLLTQVIRTECHDYFLGRALPLLFEFLRRSFFFRFLFLKTFSCYRWMKSSKVHYYLKKYSIERPEVFLEPLDKQNEVHLKTMYEVRTHPDVASRLCGTPPQNYEQHLQYLTKAATDKLFFIITADQIPCGYCQATIKRNEIELGWALHPTWWGKSIGSTAVRLLIEYVKKEYPSQSDQICLIVKKDNLAALHIYKKNGFIIQSSDDLKNEYFMQLR